MCFPPAAFDANSFEVLTRSKYGYWVFILDMGNLVLQLSFRPVSGQLTAAMFFDGFERLTNRVPLVSSLLSKNGEK